MSIGSNWTVISDISVNGNVGTSRVRLNGVLDLLITTTVGSSGITEQFTFTNIDADIAHLVFDDYFNFHANGSDGGDLNCPTTTYSGGIVTTTGFTGGGCSPIVSNGNMYGSFAPGGPVVLPTTWDLGRSTSVLADIAADTFNQGLSFTGDGATDLVWDLGALGVGQSVTFTVNKNFQRVPEPASLAPLGAGLLGTALLRRRRS